MCDAPLYIENPFYKSPIKDPLFLLSHNTTDSAIPVPCGRCATCIHLKQIYYIQRVQMESLNHDLFYGTLTYNTESLPIATYGDISFAYPDYSDWQKMIKMIRKDYPDLKFSYLLVSEYGGRKHRPHYHFILSLPRESDKLADKWSKAQDLFSIFLRYWRRNYGSTRVPIWRPLCTYKRTKKSYNFDLHYLDPYSSKDGLDSVAFYVTKYVLKFDEWVDKFKSKLYYSLSEADFVDAWSKLRPRRLTSKGFGSPDDPDVVAHITNGINFSLNDNNALFPYFISRVNGSTYPLAPYYSKRFLNIHSKITFFQRCLNAPDKDSRLAHDDFEKREFQLNLARSYLNNQTSFLDFDDMTAINDFSFNESEFKCSPLLASVFADSWEDF